ncbi:MAG: hypothetical protein HEQ13_07290 [Dolichospermum sp. DEX189]|uniref:hypothetical protein n=1 Tax=Aphanizomenon flos-aquae TaxID=1176 RepID=UPI000ABEC9F4|nr:hypothetical protein [Aphanizomenon flos-aquae]MBO1069181.1 hypothetical protein [Dolichospermum sp. DEX189]QSV70347.1 MAG: hypothetical protein HEQ20_05660 [Aphanizomenon flos-aquae KM1D3_PB]
MLENGFYQLRLRATDISDAYSGKLRTTFTQIIVEVNTATKPSAYTRTQTDLSITSAT